MRLIFLPVVGHRFAYLVRCDWMLDIAYIVVLSAQVFLLLKETGLCSGTQLSSLMISFILLGPALKLFRVGLK